MFIIQMIALNLSGLILIGVVIFAGFLLRKRKMKRLMEYDKFPDVEGYELKMEQKSTSMIDL
jgi:hypothetical protein